MKLLDIINLDTTICLTTEKYLNEEISIKEYNSYLTSLELLVEQDRGGLAEKFLSPLSTALQKITSSLKNLSEGLIIRIVNLVNRILKAVIRFKEKHPRIFKFVVAFAVVIFVVMFMGTVSAYAQDPDGFQYSSTALDAMIGLVDQMAAQGVFAAQGELATSVDEAKFLLGDLKDGVIDSGDIGQSAWNIARQAEYFFLDLLDKADIANDSSSDAANRAMSTLQKALETGQAYFEKGIKGIQGFAVDSSGKLYRPG